MPSQPIYEAAGEQALMTRLWEPAIANDPEAFVRFAYPWGQKGTDLEKHKGPRRWQLRALRRVRRMIEQNLAQEEAFAARLINEAVYEALQMARVSGRGVGKSALLSWLLHWFLTCRIGSTVIVSANSEPQLRSVTWGELAKWTALLINTHWWDLTATRLAPQQWIADLVERDLKKGTRYWGAEGKLWTEENPDSYAGPHNPSGMMVIFDESSGIPDSIWKVAKGFFTEPTPNRIWLALGNGRRNTGYFFECFNGKREFWDNEQINGLEVEGTDHNIYRQIIEEFGADSNEARIEVYGEFPSQGEDQFIGREVVQEAIARPAWRDPNAPRVIGIDPARGGADSSALVVRQGRDILAIRTRRSANTMDIVGWVIEAIREFEPMLTVIDEGGLGYGILDRLKEQGYKVRGVNFGWKSSNKTRWYLKRAEMWDGMRKWLRDAHIPDDRQLVIDLTGPKESHNSLGASVLESKDDMKKRGLASPDRADALCVTFAYPVSAAASSNVINFAGWG